MVITSLDKPIIGRYIRIHPLEWHGHISFRFELYGCYSGELKHTLRCFLRDSIQIIPSRFVLILIFPFEDSPTPEPPACMASLGLESRKVPVSAITASSIANANYKASNGRLQAQPGNGGYGWIPSSQKNQEWFHVDFGSWTKVARIAIQGRQNAARWLTKFKLTYSYDGLFFKEYIEDGRAKVLNVQKPVEKTKIIG